MIRLSRLALAAVPLVVTLSPPALAQSGPQPVAPPYADLADLVLAAPIIADATVRSVVRLKGADAAGVPPGMVRYYLEAQVTALVRGAGGLPPRVGWVYDVAPDARARLPSFKKSRVLLFARPTPVAGQLQLVSPDAQLGWTADTDGRTRQIAREALDAGAPPRITGVGDAFHVPGALPGEGETQVFLQTDTARPVSLTVLRRPGEQPRWAVALSEIVDDAAAPVQRDTLLWYRLACSLPPVLPAHSIAAASPDNAARARADYRFVIDALGPCGRQRLRANGTPPPPSGDASPA